MAMTENDSDLIEKLNRIADQLLSGKCKSDLDIDGIDGVEDNGLRLLAQNLVRIGKEYRDCSEFILSLANGKLNVLPPPMNMFASPFKQLHSELRHLTWQIQQVADGDYGQKVSFSGDFSDAINKMIVKLRERHDLAQKIRENEARLQQYSEQLDESNRTKDKLFSIISHDLKGHFNVLLGFGNILVIEAKKDNANIEYIREYSTLIHTSASGAFSLLVNLLDWAQLQSNRITVKPESFNLNDIIWENVEAGQVMAANKGIVLTYMDNHRPYPLVSDRAMINTVLRNLIGNAIKYTPQDGQITVCVKAADNKYVVSVKNSGMGIPEDVLGKLFGSGEVRSTPGTAEETGTGLGLGICKDFIDKLGGSIWAESVYGSDATFYFTLADIS